MSEMVGRGIRMVLKGMKGKRDKETYAWVLDLLPYGYPNDPRPVYQKKPVVQAVGEERFTLMELSPKRGKMPNLHERVYIGEGLSLIHI